MENNRHELTEADKLVVWRKASIVSNTKPSIWRKDYAGAWIEYNKYGNTNSKYGWQADHLKPLAKGGIDDVSNMLPLHWKNNETKSDDYPQWNTSVSSVGNKNKDKEQHWHIKNRIIEKDE
jgi:hypothetical protein